MDNSHTFPKLITQRVINSFGNTEIWFREWKVSLAFHLGTRHAKGEYIVYNDVHRDCMDEMIQQMKEEELEYISVDNKKIWIQSYILHKDKLDPY